MATIATNIIRHALAPLKFAAFRRAAKIKLDEHRDAKVMVAVCLSPDKMDICRHICGDDTMIDLSKLTYERFRARPEYIQDWLHSLTSNIRDVGFLTVGRRDRALLGLDLNTLGNPVTRFEVCLLPNLFKNSPRPFIGYMKDHIGPYFDGSGNTELESALNDLSPGWWHEDPIAVDFLEDYKKSRIQKYLPIDYGKVTTSLRETDIVVLGQCTGDQALVYTDGVAKTNFDLVSRVIEDYSCKKRRIFYRAHPRNPKNTEEIAQLAARHPRDLTILEPTVPFLDLIERRPTVATMTSGAALEAAIRGCPVVTYATSFFSNWGFTEDALHCTRRTTTLSVEDVFLYVYTKYSTYMNPYGDGSITALEALRGFLNDSKSP
ncbi:hypothetical protein [Mesorhizobium sp. ANAO-SY3R2]|uniref:capsular polysaccharide export protein, LipB/KpsS family n=1 Tax=Mesorhizobium sp. ANAO-SY3R2 TaxID=3166644 RepID=UPI00366BAED1